jgi:hypothetical protein
MNTAGREILNREALQKKLEITNNLEYLEEAIKSPIKYSHIKLKEEHQSQIEDWYVQRAMDLLEIKREEAEIEYSWFQFANYEN